MTLTSLYWIVCQYVLISFVSYVLMYASNRFMIVMRLKTAIRVYNSLSVFMCVFILPVFNLKRNVYFYDGVAIY